MNSPASLFAYGACLVLGMVLGIALALARPGSLRQLAKKLGLRDANLQWFYDQTVAFHKRVDACVPHDAVLFMGDSFIQGLCVTEVADHGINYGIGGDTTDGLLLRLPAYPSLARARAVVLAIGYNDLRSGRAEDEIISNYRKILAQMPKKILVFFCSLAPCGENPKSALMNRGIVALNRAIEQLCFSQSACHFVNLTGSLSDGRGFLLPQYADNDGLHLNGRGYRVCIEKLRESLAQCVTELAE